MSDKHAVDHAFHVWINQRQEQRHKNGEPWEHDLYEWKSALQEVERLPIWLKRARTNALPTIHQQCSRQEPEAITENVLICALGVNVAECPILASLYETFRQQNEWREGLKARGMTTPGLTAEAADEVGGKVCAWHIFTTKLKSSPGLDTSEGYVQDESDRRFWKNTYDNLNAMDADYDEDDETSVPS